MSVNRRALTADTGATAPMNEFSALRNLVKPVEEFDPFRSRHQGSAPLMEFPNMGGDLVGFERRIVLVQLVENPSSRFVGDSVTQVEQRSRLLRSNACGCRLDQSVEVVLGAGSKIEAHDQSEHVWCHSKPHGPQIEPQSASPMNVTDWDPCRPGKPARENSRAWVQCPRTEGRSSYSAALTLSGTYAIMQRTGMADV